MGSLGIMLKASTFGLLLFLGLASASAVDLTACEYCENFVTVLWGHFTRGHGVAFQTHVIDEDVCPHKNPENPSACRDEVAFYWPGINHVLYDVSNVNGFCTQATGLNCTHPEPSMQKLDQQNLGNITECDTCIDEVVAYGGISMYPELDGEAERYLQGPGYCANPTMGFNLHQQADCAHFLQGLIAPFSAALDLRLTTHAQDICHFWFGACHGE